jgi:hypothetical protein
MALRWGKLLDTWHDEGRVFHLLKDDGSPACGVPYFTSSAYPADFAPFQPRCRRCDRKERAALSKQRTTPR